MASDKQRKKAAKAAKKPAAAPPGPFRHSDGDRRHRDTMGKAVRDAKVQKDALRLIGAVDLPDEDGEEA